MRPVSDSRSCKQTHELRSKDQHADEKGDQADHQNCGAGDIQGCSDLFVAFPAKAFGEMFDGAVHVFHAEHHGDANEQGGPLP